MPWINRVKAEHACNLPKSTNPKRKAVGSTWYCRKCRTEWEIWRYELDCDSNGNLYSIPYWRKTGLQLT